MNSFILSSKQLENISDQGNFSIGKVFNIRFEIQIYAKDDKNECLGN